mmetsp:Transcript_9465/g.27852  ORF Transcript_9465/g.27852 Transcript_9465/m.27852 type:complete len:214 (-) Transcript_9465:72-713(-)
MLGLEAAEAGVVSSVDDGIHAQRRDVPAPDANPRGPSMSPLRLPRMGSQQLYGLHGLCRQQLVDHLAELAAHGVVIRDEHIAQQLPAHAAVRVAVRRELRAPDRREQHRRTPHQHAGTARLARPPPAAAGVARMRCHPLWRHPKSILRLPRYSLLRNTMAPRARSLSPVPRAHRFGRSSSPSAASAYAPTESQVYRQAVRRWLRLARPSLLVR